MKSTDAAVSGSDRRPAPGFGTGGFDGKRAGIDPAGMGAHPQLQMANLSLEGRGGGDAPS